MKIAVSGKGGSGKTIFVASLGLLFSQKQKIYLIDADPDGNLGITLGFSKEELSKIQPISELKELIKERTESSNSGVYKLNPDVSDIPEKYSLKKGNLSLLILGSLKKAGSGCYCPENTFLKSLIAHLILKSDEVVLIDMPAGIEHLTRGTAASIDGLYIMVEPTAKSIQTAQRIVELAKDLKIKSILIVANKIQSSNDLEYIRQNLKSQIDINLPYDRKLTEFEQQKLPLQKTDFFNAIKEKFIS